MGYSKEDLSITLWYLGSKGKWEKVYNARNRNGNDQSMIAQFVIEVHKVREKQNKSNARSNNTNIKSMTNNNNNNTNTSRINNSKENDEKEKAQVAIEQKADENCVSTKLNRSDELTFSMNREVESKTNANTEILSHCGPIDGAILYCNPLVLPGHLSLESLLGTQIDILGRRLQFSNYNNKLFKLFTGVLTKACLLQCIHRGVKFLHISGRNPPPAQVGAQDECGIQLQVEDKFGGCQEMEKKLIEQAMVANSENKKELKMVFISMDDSLSIGNAFVDANVDHVIIFDRQTMDISDCIATKFANTFYDSLFVQGYTVKKAFDSATARVGIFSSKDDNNSNENSSKLTENKMKCLLLGNGDHNQTLFKKEEMNSKQVTDIESGQELKVLNYACPTNIGPFSGDKLFLLGRQKDVQRLVTVLNPLNEKSFNVSVLFGRRGVGTTTAAKLVGKFFSRPWYEAIFPGGVWYIDLKQQSHVISTHFFQTITSVMKLKDASSQFLYFEMENNKNNKSDNSKPIKYKQEINHKLCQIEENLKSNNNGFDNYYYDDYTHHFIFFKKSKDLREKETLKRVIQTHYSDVDDDEIDKIYNILSNNKANLDVSIQDGTGHIDAKSFFVKNASVEDAKRALIGCKSQCKLIIVDHIGFESKEYAKIFLKHLNELVNGMKCRVLIVLDKDNFEMFEDGRDDEQYLCIKEFRLNPLSPNVVSHLIDQSRSRMIQQFDFQIPANSGIDSIKSNFLQWRLCLWSGRAPCIVKEIVRLMDKRVPLWIMEYICQKLENGEMEQTRKVKIETLLNFYNHMLFSAVDSKEDALRALVIFVSKLSEIMNEWNDKNGTNDENDENESNET